MTISILNAENEIAYALAKDNDRLIFDKTSLSSQLAGGYTSMFRAGGFPVAGVIPTAAAICTKALTGAMSFVNEAGGKENYLAWAYYTAGTAGHAFEVHDRLAHMGGLSGTVTTAQNVLINLATLGGGISADRRGDANYMDVQWGMEWYTATGGTGVNATINVTYDDDSTGNIVVAIPATTGAGRYIPIQPAVAGRGIKAVNTITLSATTGTAGNFGVTASRHRTTLENDIAGKGKNHPWQLLGIPRIIDDSCLFGIVPSTATASGACRGQIKLAKI